MQTPTGLISPPTPEKSGELGKDMKEEELEGESLPATRPDVKEEGPVDLNKPGPADMPGRSPDPEGAMLERSPLGQGRPPPGCGETDPSQDGGVICHYSETERKRLASTGKVPVHVRSFPHLPVHPLMQTEGWFPLAALVNAEILRCLAPQEAPAIGPSQR